MFYCNFGDPFTVLNEVDASSTGRYLLVAYEAVSRIKCRCIGVFEPEACARLREANPEVYDAYHLFHDFLADEFSQEVPVGDEQRYLIAKTIADDYFFFDDGCIGYPSAKKAPGLNLKMDPKYAHSNLRIRCVLLGGYDSSARKYAVTHFSFPRHDSFRNLELVEAGAGLFIDDLFSSAEAVLPCLDVRGEEVTISAYLPNRAGITKLLNGSK